MREQLRRGGVPEAVVDDAVLVLSELLSNSCRYGRPLDAAGIGEGAVRAAWRIDVHGALTVEVTDGGGPTRPVPSTPSVTARGGRGLNIIDALARDWGVRDSASGEVTVWALMGEAPPRHEGTTARAAGRRDGSAGGPLPRVNGARHLRAPGRAGSRTGAVANTAPPPGGAGFLGGYEDTD